MQAADGCELGVGPTSIAAGSQTRHACAILPGGSVKCWGPNQYGQLGLGDTNNRGSSSASEMGDNLPAVSLGTDRTATAVALGGDFSCALLDDGTVKCWGRSEVGQLGQGDTLSRGDEPNEMGDMLPVVPLGANKKAVAIAAGQTHVCAILDDATVKCWGENPHGQLGLGDAVTRGDTPGQMGDQLPVVQLGAGKKVVQLALGYNHSCALFDDGTVKCWGRSDAGQLGQGDTLNHGNEPNQMGDQLPVVPLGTNKKATTIGAGGALSCVLLDDATVKCWGVNFSGQLGQGDTLLRGDEPNEMGDNLAAIDLGAGKKVALLSVGTESACAVLNDATVKCWGGSEYGKLGLGDGANRGDDPNEMGDNLPTVDLGAGKKPTAVSVGADYACALFDDASVKVWGDYTPNGLGDGIRHGETPNTMGNNLPALSVGTWPSCP